MFLIFFNFCFSIFIFSFILFVVKTKCQENVINFSWNGFWFCVKYKNWKKRVIDILFNRNDFRWWDKTINDVLNNKYQSTEQQSSLFHVDYAYFDFIKLIGSRHISWRFINRLYGFIDASIDTSSLILYSLVSSSFSSYILPQIIIMNN